MRIRKCLIFIIALFILLTGCTPKDKTENISDIDQTKTENNLKSSIEILTSDEFEGRKAGTRGNKNATEFIENKFKEMSLRPFFEDGYLHPFVISTYQPGEQEHTLTVEYENGEKETLELGEDYVYRTIVRNLDNEEIMIPITTDVDDEKISEKIVLTKGSLEKVFGIAKGVILQGNNFRNPSFHSSPFYIFEVSPKIYNQMFKDKAKALYVTAPHSIKDITPNNVIGLIEGKDNQKAIVLSAHFDHVGKTGNTIFRGAIDNASGTAVLLDLAERLKIKSVDSSLNKDIIIAAFNAEEDGLIGSFEFVKDYAKQYDDIININIDCVGSKTAGAIYLDDSFDINDELIKSLKLYLDKYNLEYTDGYYGLSDNHSFATKNYPAITIGQGELEYIHTKKDTIDDVDFDYLERVSNAVFDFVVNHK